MHKTVLAAHRSHNLGMDRRGTYAVLLTQRAIMVSTRTRCGLLRVPSNCKHVFRNLLNHNVYVETVVSVMFAEQCTLQGTVLVPGAAASAHMHMLQCGEAAAAANA